jgi:hypothetical protein
MPKYSFLLLFILASSCQDWKVDVAATNPDKSFSVNSLISPLDSIIRVDVNRIQEVISEPTPYNVDLSVSNAQVIISGGGQEATLIYDEDLHYYVSQPNQIIIKANETYLLKVEVNGVLLTAKTTVPEGPLVSDSSIELVEQTVDVVTFKFRWVDPNQGLHSYLILNRVQIGNGSTNANLENNEGEYGSFIESPIGIQKTYEFSGGFSKFNKNTTEPSVLRMLIYSANPDFKEFIDDNYRSVAGVKSEIGLFERFQNPTNRYSNIENGYGIFAAYNLLTLKLVVENN